MKKLQILIIVFLVTLSICAFASKETKADPPQPSISVEPSSATIDNGQSATLSSTVTGGTEPITWQWSDEAGLIPGASGTGDTATYITSSADTGIYVTFTDANSLTATSNPTVTVTVNSALVAPTVSTNLNVIDQSQTSDLTSTPVTTGTGPYSYQWLQESPSDSSFLAITNQNSASYNFATDGTTASGPWSFELQVTDSATSPVVVTSAPFLVTVNSAPSVNVSPTSCTMDTGQSQTFSATPSGGSESYAYYQWYVNGSAQSDQTSSTFSYSPDSSGTFSITATVTDSLSATSIPSSAATLTVNQLTITVTQTANGLISPGSSPVNYSATPSFSITPATGYSIASITTDSDPVLVTSSSGQTVGFTNVQANHTITATYAQNSYVLTVITVGQGTVAPGNETSSYGTLLNLTATSASGWSFEGWSNNVTSLTTQVTMNSNQTITATFTQNPQATPTPTPAATPAPAPTSTPTPAPTSTASPTPAPEPTQASIPSAAPTNTPISKAQAPTAAPTFSLATMGQYLAVVAAAVILGAVVIGLVMHRRKPPNIVILS